jgi:dipeptidyl aminopeptidase/acylaminoacyl peptidase
MKYLIATIVVTGSILAAWGGVHAAPAPTTPPLNRSELAQTQPTATPPAISIPAANTPLTSTRFISAPAVAGPALKAEVSVAALNVRQGPGLGYPVIKTALQGDSFEVIGRDQSGNWLQVSLPEGGVAWISGVAPYTRLLAGNLAEMPVAQTPSLTTASIASGATQPALNPAKPSGPAGERLIFATRSGGDLYVIQADGGGLRRLTQGVIDPVVSPDGRQVAFTRWDGAELGSLHVLNVDDGSERVVVGDIRQPKSPAWSPDGQKIVISFQHGGLRDPVEECRGFEAGERVRLPENAVITKFHVGQDGTVEACFIRNEDLQWILRQVDVATGVFEDLPSDEYAYNPSWDPHSPWRVIYDGNWGLMQIDVTNGQQWPITEDLRDTGPVFSPDGQRLALTYKQHDHWEVYTLDLATHARQRLTKPPILADPQYNSAAPAWSPDGGRLAFVTDRSGRWEIWVMNADGSQQRPLFSPEIQAQLGLEYHGVNERLLNWVE